MHTHFKQSLLLTTVFLSSLTVQADLSVFACEPEWQALVTEIAPKAKVYSATTAKQDPHHIQARPSLIAKIRQADLLVCSGAELEAGWLPVLQQRSGNPNIQSKDKGVFFAADHVDTIGKVENPSPTMGDVHPEGNPHLHLDPYRIEQLANALTQRMGDIDPDNKAEYQKNLKRFTERWRKQITLWEEQAKPLKGLNVMTYHTSFDYLLGWLGIHVSGDLEPKPGIPPSAQHLNNLLQKTKKTPVNIIIYASYQNKKPAEWLSGQTKIPSVELPISIGGNEQSTDLFSLYDSLIHQLLGAIPTQS